MLTNYIGTKHERKLIDNSLSKAVDLAEPKFFESIIYWSVKSHLGCRPSRGDETYTG